MKLTCDIYSLEYAIVEFASAIEALLRFVNGVVPGDPQIAGILNIEIEEVNEIVSGIRIHPASWPESSQFFATLMKDNYGTWKAYEGSLSAPHLFPEPDVICFKCFWNQLGRYEFIGENDAEKEFISALYARRSSAFTPQQG